MGCGRGQKTKYLKDLGVDIVGLDLSEKSLKQAETNCPGINFKKGNLLDLEFDDSSIAAVVAFYAVIHFTETQVETAFSGIFRVLQPGGLFLFTYHIGRETIRLEDFLGKKIDVDFMLFSSDFINRCLKMVGFSEIKSIERDPYPGIEYETRRACVFAKKYDQNRKPYRI